MGLDLFSFDFIMPPIYFRSLGRGHYEMTGVVRLSVCRMPQPNSGTERPTKPKISAIGARHTSNQ